MVADVLVSLFAEERSTARFYIYAQRDTPARSWQEISSGPNLIAELKQGRFFAVDVSAGRYTFSTKTGAPVSVEIKDGESHSRVVRPK